MAKMIKCPTCGTQIEVPPGPPGGGPQIIKCPGCGKGLKIVAKKPPGAPANGLGGSMAGGSMSGTVAGGSVSAMSFHGEPAPPQNDLSQIDAPCEVCGRMTPADELTEDNGRMVCGDCIKGARSRVERPEETPELMDFKRPLPAVKRGKLIRITPSLIGVVVAGIVLISCQIYLTLIEQPKGRGRAMASPTPAGVHPTTKPNGTTPVPPVPSTTQSSSTENTNPGSTQPAVTFTQPPASTGPSVAVVTPDTSTPPAPKPSESIFNEAPPTTTTAPTADPATPPTPDTTAIATGPEPVAPTPAPGNPSKPLFAPNDPLVKGIEQLNNRDYNSALQILSSDETLRKYRLTGRPPDQLSNEQQMVAVGIAAAYIGRGKAEDLRVAMARLTTVLGQPTAGVANPRPATGRRTRSAVMNYTIAAMTKKPVSPAEIYYACQMLGEFLPQSRGDEYAADVFGTLLERAATYPNSAQFVQAHQRNLDTYINELAQSDPRYAGKLKWGVEWKDAALVTQYRASRGRGPITQTPDELQRELEAAKTKVLSLKQAVDTAKANGGDVVGAQNQYQASLATLGEVQMRVEQAAAPAPKPKWLEKFEPVVPEGMAATQ